MARPALHPTELTRTLLRRNAVRGDVPTRALLALDRLARTGAGVTWDGVADRLVSEAPCRISVDVFDTVLSRRVVGDDAIFWMTGVALAAERAWTDSPLDFVEARRAAARAQPNGTLEQIYAAPPLVARCEKGAGPCAEVAAEHQLIIPVEGADRALQRLRAAGHDLVLVSDMHLSRQHLQAFLGRLGLDVTADELVISSEVGASKWGGTLFPLLMAAQPPVRWHVGNDLWSDVAMAERAGLRAMPLKAAEPTELEALMADAPGSLGSVIAGAARIARWGSGPAEPVEGALREAGADVAGQCLTAFLLWIREECDAAGIDQLVFLARDGELPFQMARAMPPDHWDGFEMQYLQGSRRLWSMGAAAVIGVGEWLHAGTSDDSSFVRQDQHSIPWSSLLGRIGLSLADVAGHPILADLPPGRPLPRSCDGAWRALLADESIRARISGRAAIQYDNLCQHLHDMGTTGGRIAVVDVGWRGQLAWHVSAVVRAVTGQEPLHLHFGGVNVAPEAARAEIRRYAMDDSVAPPPFPDVVSCVETFTASGHPRVHTLESDGAGGVRPVFDRPTPEVDTTHRRLLWEGALDVARNMPSRSQLERWGLTGESLPERVRLVLRTFWLTPSSMQALAAAHLAGEADDAGDGINTIASPYRLRDRDGANRMWRQGSLRLTPPVLRYPIRLLLAARTALRRMRGRREGSHRLV